MKYLPKLLCDLAWRGGLTVLTCHGQTPFWISCLFIQTLPESYQDVFISSKLIKSMAARYMRSLFPIRLRVWLTTLFKGEVSGSGGTWRTPEGTWPTSLAWAAP